MQHETDLHHPGSKKETTRQLVQLDAAHNIHLPDRFQVPLQEGLWNVIVVGSKYSLLKYLDPPDHGSSAANIEMHRSRP